ncbi:MAG: hypothetical protein RMY28_004240 [Nostoc sp. ChiSLP01]|nr:hypothetical protein [Nostoc sp. CmiSLP01]MDZ8286239.1 hypothetical protein [Nostoc sp. ChiSLP01]
MKPSLNPVFNGLAQTSIGNLWWFFVQFRASLLVFQVEELESHVQVSLEL